MKTHKSMLAKSVLAAGLALASTGVPAQENGNRDAQNGIVSAGHTKRTVCSTTSSSAWAEV